MYTMTEFRLQLPHQLGQLLNKVVSTFLKRLQMIMSSGLTPQKLALTLCIGIALGTMPIVWGSSLICFLLAHIFKLNQVALQSVNYLLYPLQLALLVPFFKVGAWMFSWGPPVPLNMLSTLLHSPELYSLNILGWITLKSVAAWLVTVLPAAVLAYILQRVIASRINSRRMNKESVL